jgi:hypothetical protein
MLWLADVINALRVRVNKKLTFLYLFKKKGCLHQQDTHIYIYMKKERERQRKTERDRKRENNERENSDGTTE